LLRKESKSDEARGLESSDLPKRNESSSDCAIAKQMGLVEPKSEKSRLEEGMKGLKLKELNWEGGDRLLGTSGEDSEISRVEVDSS